MILIFSEEDDCSSNYVIDWLAYYNVNVIRINPDIGLTQFKILINDNEEDIILKHENISISISEITSFWYRRGNLNNSIVFTQSIQDDFYQEITNHLKKEFNTIENHIVHVLEQKKTLGSYFNGNANKLTSLLTAKEVGLKIPRTLISDKKSDLIDFAKKNKTIITKGVQDVLIFTHEKYRYNYYTSTTNIEDIQDLSDSFFPSLLQENIIKLYEIRTFFLKGKCYSMAIFSQEDDQTKVDFRHYNQEKPNRNVPYKLPAKIENKIDAFMKKMHLDTGSIDLIYSTKHEYIFLEVNPVGQYDMVSVTCNYFLDKEIAKYLMN